MRALRRIMLGLALFQGVSTLIGVVELLLVGVLLGAFRPWPGVGEALGADS